LVYPTLLLGLSVLVLWTAAVALHSPVLWTASMALHGLVIMDHAARFAQKRLPMRKLGP
jgi:hypothetical protein